MDTLATIERPAREPADPPARLWRPKRVLVARSAMAWEHGREIVARAEGLGIDVEMLASDRLSLALPEDERRAYALAK